MTAPAFDGLKDYDALPLIGFKLTDLGNAERLVTRFGKHVRYCHPMRTWFVWDGKRWGPDSSGKVVRLAYRTAKAIYPEAFAASEKEESQRLFKHALKSESANSLKNMVILAQSWPGIPIAPAELDSDPWLFNVDNGTIDLRTGELRGHRQEDLITKLSTVEYAREAEHATWFKFLAEVTGGDSELAAYIRRAVGYALQGTVSEKAFWFLYGPPDGGKSTFIHAIGGIFGEYYSVANSDTWIVQGHAGGNRGDLVRLRAARLVGSVEVRKGAKLDEALVKGVTGGDVLTAAAKYQEDISFLPSFALWMAGNDAPEIRDDDDGSWARVRRVPFTSPIPKGDQDRGMASRLAQDDVRAAILAWAVHGCLEWQRDGMGLSGAVEASSAEYRSENDRTAGFFHSECIFHRIERCESSVIWDAYKRWCEIEGTKILISQKELGARLLRMGCQPTRLGHSGSRGWVGVRLRSDADAVLTEDRC